MSESAKKPELSLSNIESTLEEYLVHKAPFQLPVEIKEAIVKYGPWVLLVLMVLTLPVLVAGLGLTALFAPFGMMGYGMMGGRSVFSYVPTILTLISLIFNIIALPGLFNRTMAGWRNAYYAQLLSVAANILSLNLGSAIISGLIGFYILFQVKSKYKA